MAKYKVWLDAGHGGTDSGAVGNGLVEKTLNLTTTLSTREVLIAHNVEVGMTRTTDVTRSITERCKLANNWKADYFVSIHHNSASGNNGDGAEAIHSIYAGAGEKLAKSIVKSIDAYTEQNLRPTPTFSKKSSNGTDYYGVIRQTNMHAVIVECAFINSTDRYVVDTVAEQKAMGVAIARGILVHLGISYKGTNPTPPSTSGDKFFKVCVASYPEKEKAKTDKLVAELKGKKIDAYSGKATVKGKVYYRAYAGAYKDRKNADSQLAKVKSLGYSEAFMVVE